METGAHRKIRQVAGAMAEEEAGRGETLVPADRRSEINARDYSWSRSAIVCLALLLEGMSASSINVQVAALRDALHIGPVQLGLITAAFLVSYAGLLPMAGRLVDVWGRGRTFLVGTILFGIGCLVCASAVAGWMIGVGRLIQGGGAALSAPAALALVTYGLTAGSLRNRAVALYGSMGAAGFSLGLVLPAFVVAAAGWRASFLVLVPVVLVVMGVAWSVRHDGRANQQRVDLVGSGLLTATMILAVAGISLVGTAPLLRLVALLLGVLVLGAVLKRRGGVAGFPAELLRSRRIMAMCLALGGTFAGAISSYLVLSLSLANQGHGALAVGLMILPNPVAFALLAGPGGKLAAKVGVLPTLLTGMLLIAAALGFLAVLGSEAAYVLGMLPAQLAVGVGLALVFPAASIGAVDAAPEEHRGTTAGLLTTWQNVGGATGLAVVTALGAVPVVGATSNEAPGLLIGAGLVALAALTVVVTAGRRTQ